MNMNDIIPGKYPLGLKGDEVSATQKKGKSALSVSLSAM